MSDIEPTLEAPPGFRRYFIIRVTVTLVLLVALLITALNNLAGSNLDASYKYSKLDDRLASAERAAFLQPWNRAFAVRVATLQAQVALHDGDTRAALGLLTPLIADGKADRDFMAAYRSASGETSPTR